MVGGDEIPLQPLWLRDGSLPLSLSLFLSLHDASKSALEEFRTNSLQDCSLGSLTSWHFAPSKMAHFQKNVSGKAMRTMRCSRSIQASKSPGIYKKKQI